MLPHSRVLQCDDDVEAEPDNLTLVVVFGVSNINDNFCQVDVLLGPAVDSVRAMVFPLFFKIDTDNPDFPFSLSALTHDENIYSVFGLRSGTSTPIEPWIGVDSSRLILSLIHI